MYADDHHHQPALCLPKCQISPHLPCGDIWKIPTWKEISLQIYHAEKFEISPHVENVQISPHMSCIEIWNISTWQFFCADVSVRSLTISLNKNAARTCKGHGCAPTCDILSSFLSVLLSHLFFFGRRRISNWSANIPPPLFASTELQCRCTGIHCTLFYFQALEVKLEFLNPSPVKFEYWIEIEYCVWVTRGGQKTVHQNFQWGTRNCGCTSLTEVKNIWV